MKRVAIVTGAGSGIGRAICEKLSADGICLLLNGRREALIEETASLLRSGADVCCIAGDISDEQTAERLVDEAMRRWGQVDIVVNNAGVATRRPIEQTDTRLLDTIFATNLVGPALLISRVWSEFKRQGNGLIINISSLAAHDPFPGFFVYGASKSALESLTRSALNEADWGAQAYNIAVGTVNTPLLQNLFPADKAILDSATSPSEVANIVSECIRGQRMEDNGKTIFCS